jgi:hypothetical protein
MIMGTVILTRKRKAMITDTAMAKKMIMDIATAKINMLTLKRRPVNKSTRNHHLSDKPHPSFQKA